MHFAARDDMFLPSSSPAFLRSCRCGRAGCSTESGPAAGCRSSTFSNPKRAGRGRRGTAGHALPPPRGCFRRTSRPASPSGPPRAALLARRRRGDVLRGEYADLLWGRSHLGTRTDWTSSERESGPGRGDFRTLVEIVRDGNVLIVFPEGRPSPDGEIGPIRPGIGVLVRRASLAAVRPLAVAYDPLVRGRTRACIAHGPPVQPPWATSRASSSRSCG